MEHAADAPLEVLARRLYFDLTGMPPTTGELHEFQQMAGQTQEAALATYGGIVDRLLSSPRFGERWGRHWLDLARFAESSGGGRTLPSRMPGATVTM
ncbi:DUF1549 domain-containing protein [Verrucomicrobium spinosum]|uniref:DUF1549 domain-containing protein n=1 Tax=Verrucomicrobium spinosum TaxID=2736 RepID=UPI0031B5B811